MERVLAGRLRWRAAEGARPRALPKKKDLLLTLMRFCAEAMEEEEEEEEEEAEAEAEAACAIATVVAIVTD